LRQKIGLWVVFMIYSFFLLIYCLSNYGDYPAQVGFMTVIAFFIPLALLIYKSLK